MKVKRSRLDYKAAAQNAAAKGSTGDRAVKGLLQSVGWAQVADLARTYSGADLLAVCACKDKHLLWLEVKAYAKGKIEKGSWDNLVARALEVTARPREEFALFTYQQPSGGRTKPKEWYASRWYVLEDGGCFGSHLPFISSSGLYRPDCRTPLPIGDRGSPLAPPEA
jgi:hypothetical protein